MMSDETETPNDVIEDSSPDIARQIEGQDQTKVL